MSTGACLLTGLPSNLPEHGKKLSHRIRCLPDIYLGKYLGKFGLLVRRIEHQRECVIRPRERSGPKYEESMR